MATRNNGWMVRLFDADRARVEALAKRFPGVEIPITAVVRSAILAAVQAAGIDDPAEPKPLKKEKKL